MRYIILFICSLLTTAVSHGQDISGRWVGNYSGDGSMSRPQKVVVEISVAHDSIISGSSHLYYADNDYEHYTIRGVYHKKDSTIFFFEDSTLGVKLGLFVQNCLGNYKMKLRIRDSVMRFEGRWKVNPDSEVNCGTQGVWLAKNRPPVTPKIALVAPKPKDKNLDRPLITQSLIEISKAEKDSIKVEVIDNKEIDNDAVSIYVNGEQVVKKQLLSKKPIVFYVSVSKREPLCRIVMAAESMGSVPPCTALMRVIVGGKVHEATLSSNMGNNGTLELFLKE
jgi:hypothetical protein